MYRLTLQLYIGVEMMVSGNFILARCTAHCFASARFGFGLTEGKIVQFGKWVCVCLSYSALLAQTTGRSAHTFRALTVFGFFYFVYGGVSAGVIV